MLRHFHLSFCLEILQSASTVLTLLQVMSMISMRVSVRSQSQVKVLLSLPVQLNKIVINLKSLNSDDETLIEWPHFYEYAALIKQQR